MSFPPVMFSPDFDVVVALGVTPLVEVNWEVAVDVAQRARGAVVLFNKVLVELVSRSMIMVVDMVWLLPVQVEREILLWILSSLHP